MRIVTFSETFNYPGPGLFGYGGWVRADDGTNLPTQAGNDFVLNATGQLYALISPPATSHLDSTAINNLLIQNADWTQDFEIGFEIFANTAQNISSEDPAIWIGTLQQKFVSIWLQAALGDAQANCAHLLGQNADGTIYGAAGQGATPYARNQLHQLKLSAIGDTGHLYLDAVEQFSFPMGDRSQMKSSVLGIDFRLDYQNSAYITRVFGTYRTNGMNTIFNDNFTYSNGATTTVAAAVWGASALIPTSSSIVSHVARADVNDSENSCMNIVKATLPIVVSQDFTITIVFQNQLPGVRVFIDALDITLGDTEGSSNSYYAYLQADLGSAAVGPANQVAVMFQDNGSVGSTLTVATASDLTAHTVVWRKHGVNLTDITIDGNAILTNFSQLDYSNITTPTLGMIFTSDQTSNGGLGLAQLTVAASPAIKAADDALLSLLS